MDFTDKATKTEEKQQIDSHIAANDNIEIDGGASSGGGGDGSVVVSRQSEENGNEPMKFQNLLNNIEISNDAENSSLESAVKLPDSSTPKKLSGSIINAKSPITGRKICVDLIKTAINHGIGIELTDDLKPFCRDINAKEIIEAPGQPLYKSQINKDERIPLTKELMMDKSFATKLADIYMNLKIPIGSFKSDYVEPTTYVKEKCGFESEISTKRIDANVSAGAADLGNEMHIVQLPNFSSAKSKSFNREPYEDESSNKNVLDEEGRQRFKFNVNNTMRWREVINENGEKVKESNRQLVKSSDDSTTYDNIENDQEYEEFKSNLTFEDGSTDTYTSEKMTLSDASRIQQKGCSKLLTNIVRNDQQVAGPSGINNQRDGSKDELYVIRNSNDKQIKKKRQRS